MSKNRRNKILNYDTRITIKISKKSFEDLKDIKDNVNMSYREVLEVGINEIKKE